MTRSLLRASFGRFEQGSRRRALPAHESGLIALDWLMLTSLVLVIVSISLVVLQRALDEPLGTDDGIEPSARVHEADIEAADIESAAHAALLAWRRDGSVGVFDPNHEFQLLCEGLEAKFEDVVQSASWTAPKLAAEGSDEPAARARCELERR